MEKTTLFCRINPHNEAAKKGLERLEKQMKVRSPNIQWLLSCFGFPLRLAPLKDKKRWLLRFPCAGSRPGCAWRRGRERSWRRRWWPGWCRAAVGTVDSKWHHTKVYWRYHECWRCCWRKGACCVGWGWGLVLGRVVARRSCADGFDCMSDRVGMLWHCHGVTLM